VHPKIEQSQESDYAFMKKLAERNGFKLYVFNDTLFFKEPANDKSGVVTLEWGKGLISFSPQVNIADQVSGVEVRGWDIEKKEQIVGKAQKGDELGRDQGRKSGGDIIGTICKKNNTVLHARLPVYSQQDADQQAKACSESIPKAW